LIAEVGDTELPLEPATERSPTGFVGAVYDALRAPRTPDIAGIRAELLPSVRAHLSRADERLRRLELPPPPLAAAAE
jgi:hypothetical protein